MPYARSTRCVAKPSARYSPTAASFARVDEEHARCVIPRSASDVEAADGERAPEADALARRVDADHVDLAERARLLRRVGAGCTLVQQKPARPSVVEREQEALGVEPAPPRSRWSSVSRRPAALLGVAGERAVVHREPRRLRRCPTTKCAHGDAVGPLGRSRAGAARGVAGARARARSRPRPVSSSRCSPWSQSVRWPPPSRRRQRSLVGAGRGARPRRRGARRARPTIPRSGGARGARTPASIAVVSREQHPTVAERAATGEARPRDLTEGVRAGLVLDVVGEPSRIDVDVVGPRTASRTRASCAMAVEGIGPVSTVIALVYGASFDLDHRRQHMEMTKYEHGVPSWVDLGTPDIEKAAAFYSELFGWECPDGSRGGRRLPRLPPRREAGRRSRARR